MECPVCNSREHIHCSRGCELCDDPKNPHPTFAEKFCYGCRRSLCSICWEEHECPESDHAVLDLEAAL